MRRWLGTCRPVLCLASSCADRERTAPRRAAGSSPSERYHCVSDGDSGSTQEQRTSQVPHFCAPSSRCTLSRPHFLQCQPLRVCTSDANWSSSSGFSGSLWRCIGSSEYGEGVSIGLGASREGGACHQGCSGCCWPSGTFSPPGIQRSLNRQVARDVRDLPSSVYNSCLC